ITTGTATISYQVGTGCPRTTVVTVNAAPDSITGAAEVCVGQTTTLNNATSGGTWTSGTTAIATIGATTGILTGVAAGTTNITYTAPGGCKVTTIATVNGAPSAITGITNTCIGSSSTLSHATSGGTWSSSNTAVATVNTGTGEVTGVTAGTTTITYHISTGCFKTTTFVVNTLPATIGGSFTVCEGATTTLTNSTTGGTWSSSNTAVATVVSTTGVVTGTGSGSANISYTISATGCTVTQAVTVNPSPAVISGPTSLCSGSTTTLSTTPTGGAWTSSNTSVATVDGSTGEVTAIAGGSVNITYTAPGGCYRIHAMTIVSLPGTITGSLLLCMGNTSTLSSSTTGGTWSSSNVAVATVGSATGVVTAIGTGVSSISYTTGSGCSSTAVVTVNAGVDTIAGTNTICVGQTATFTNATTGGTWSSSAPSIATTGMSTGIVTAASAGTARITYSISGGCFTTRVITISATPAAITGPASVCVGTTATLGHPVSGGTWSSSNTSTATINGSTGVVTGVASGTATISYSLGAGCVRTTTMIVYNNPAGISGTTTVCEGSSALLTNTTSGGTWSSSDITVATINSTSGMMTGVSAGAATITYRVTTSGCQSTTTINVNAAPSAITGSTSLCAGSAETFTSTPTGGVWTSSNAGVATIGSLSGTATAVAGGSANITYTLTNGCVKTRSLSVVNLPAPITGSLTMCVGNSTTLSSTTTGGTWSSSTPSVATIGSTGFVAGVSSGTSLISYTAGTGCARTAVVTVNAALGTNSGSPIVCVGQTTTLSNATTGGAWSSGSTGIATVGMSSGIVTGVNPGTANITYSIGSGCTAITQVTVNTTPAAISGPSVVCLGSTVSLTHTVSGGSWSSANPSVASIDASGIVTGVTIGSTTITYSLSAGCYKTATIAVQPLPATISGATSLCEGSSTTLSNTTTGGTWSSGTPSVATIGSTSGSVSAIAAGSATITYQISSTGCFRTHSITVYPTPSSISGSSTLCSGNTATYTSSPSGGAWTSSNPSSASIGSASGVVTAVSAGAALLSYTLGTGCRTTMAVSVNNTPSPITGNLNMCIGTTSSLACPTTGGTWSSSTPAVASITSTGLATGASVGTTTISYTVGTGCVRTAVVTVSTTPAAGTISGPSSVYAGTTTTYSSTVSGGTWSTSSTSIATVGSSSGAVTGVAAGSVILTYTITTPCGTFFTTTAITVLASLPGITGTLTVCVGSTTTLSNSTSGGSWTSSAPAIASVGSATGIVTGNSAGTATISYIIGSTATTAVVTVLATPTLGSITGASTVCENATITLSNATTGGSWTSTAPAMATIDGSGVVSALNSGVLTISYTVSNSCGTSSATKTLTVNPQPRPGIQVGPAAVPAGGTITLQDVHLAISSPSVIASQLKFTSANYSNGGSGNWGGVPTTFTAQEVKLAPSGDAVACGTIGTGYFAGKIAIINRGTCEFGYKALQAQTAGAIAVVIVNNSSDDPINMGPGTYGASVTIPVYMITKAEGDKIAMRIAMGDTVRMTLTYGGGGGYWNSASTAIATVGSSTGAVTGVDTGHVAINYTVSNSCGTRSSVTTVNVFTPTTFSGPGVVCIGDTVAYSGSPTGGTWTSSNPSVAAFTGSGTLAGISAGTTMITYIAGSGMAMVIVTVNGAPTVSAISGPSVVCEENSITLTNATSGGSWSASIPELASIDSTGVLYALNEGVIPVSYTVSGSCGTTTVTKNVTINPMPRAGIQTGMATVGVGGTVALQDAHLAISAPSSLAKQLKFSSANYNDGGTAAWGGIPAAFSGNIVKLSSSSNPFGCSAHSTGYFTGYVALIDRGTCEFGLKALEAQTAGASACIIINNSSADPIDMGPGTYGSSVSIPVYMITKAEGDKIKARIAAGDTVRMTLTYGGGGGTWSSLAPSIATVGSTGIATGVDTGWATIHYSVSNSCGTKASATNLRVNYSAGISGPLGICTGSSVTLTGSPTGGSWSVSDTTIAIVTGSGVVYGLASGTSIVTYTSGSGMATATVTVTPAPTAGSIAGASSVAVGSTITLSNAISGGTWSSSAPSVATVGSTGVVTGVTTGSVLISYTKSNACSTAVATKAITVTGGTGAACPGTWGTVGTAGLSVGVATYQSIAIDASGVPYIAYKDASVSNKAVVKKFNGTSWVNPDAVGAVSAGSGNFTNIVIHPSGTPYVVYQEGASSAKAAVKKLSGSSWISVGAATISASTALYECIAMSADGTPYIVYRDNSWYGNPTVKKYDSSAGWVGVGGSVSGTTNAANHTSIAVTAGGTIYVAYLEAVSGIFGVKTFNATTGGWEFVGGGPITDGGQGSVAVDNAGVPYICYKDVSVGGRITVKKFVSGSWTTVGAPGISIGGAWGRNPIAFNSANEPYICYGDDSVSTGLMVKKFNGSTWVTLGSGVSIPGGGSHSAIAIDGSDNVYVAYSDATAGGKISVKKFGSPTVSGSTTVSAGGTLTLTPTVSGGTWTSSNTSVATVGSSTGVVTGIAAGTAVISYTLDSCSSTTVVTITAPKPGLYDNGNTSNVSIYPNPTNGQLFIDASVSGNLSILTIDGRVITTETIASGTNQISLPAQLARGMYVLRFKGDDGSTHVARIVLE
ncbi:MAG: Ig-like domain-containing protein, partial [Flavipsychrobacter sp.]|nr:Ig-like domain-containing protein [Flavipsychrobacter sp.]